MAQPSGVEKPPRLLSGANEAFVDVFEDALCRVCRAPLKTSAVRCPDCGTRHPMADCSCCGGALFKHASIQVIQESWQSFPSTGPLFRRLWTWLRASKQQETHYLHRRCVAQSAALLAGATAVFEPDTQFWQSSQPSVPSEGALPIANPDMPTDRHPESVSQVVDLSPLSESALTSTDTSGDLFQSIFLEESPGVADLCHPYQLGKRDFSAAQLQGLTLEHQCLKNINLSRADLQRSAWHAVDLAAVDLSLAIADYASFINTQLSGGQFRDISLRDAKVILSELSHSDFYKADLRRSDFYSSHWQHSTLTLANLTEARLDAVDLSQSCLLLTKLVRASLMEANLEKTNCEQADFSAVNLSWASLRDANLTQANCSDAVLQCADVRGADFTGAILLGTDFLSANIEEAKSFWGAKYNDLTRFPLGFAPEEKGMIKMTSSEVKNYDLLA